jgi:hypothetical protein
MAEIPFAEHNNMVKTISSDRTDQPLRISVLPWRPWRDRPISYTHCSKPLDDDIASRNEPGRRLKDAGCSSPVRRLKTGMRTKGRQPVETGLAGWGGRIRTSALGIMPGWAYRYRAALRVAADRAPDSQQGASTIFHSRQGTTAVKTGALITVWLEVRVLQGPPCFRYVVELVVQFQEIPSTMSRTKLFSRQAWDKNASIYEAIRTMPFNAQLASGTLSEVRFKHYITQDAHYLIGFGRALTLAAATSTDGARLYWLDTQHDPCRASVLACRTGGDDNGLLGAPQPLDLLIRRCALALWQPASG